MLAVGVIVALLASVLLLAPPVAKPAAASGPAALAGSVATDRAALVALYDSTGGANWKKKANWKTKKPLGQWHGVTTDKGGRVTQLELYQNGLTGEIPVSLAQLSQLTELKLYRNPALTGSIPSGLSKLTNLRKLHLYRNALSGSIPSSLGNLSELTSLNLAVNELSGPIPSSLGNLSELTSLNLHTNQLHGRMPGTLVDLSKLEHLQLRKNPGLTGCILIALQHIHDNDLEKVNLPFCSVGVPANFTAKTGANTGEVILSWTPGANATGHVVVWQKQGGRGWNFPKFGGHASGATITNLDPGQKYRFAVSAYRGSTRSYWSRFVWATAGGEAQSPVRPTIPTATPGPNPGEVTLSWTPGANATGHKVAWQKPGGSWKFKDLPRDASGTTITGLDPGHKYNFAVAYIVGSSGLGPFSPRVSATAKPLVRPTIPTATPGPNPGEVTLSWTPGANATGHVVAWQKPGGGWKFKGLPRDADGTTITGLEPGQQYNFAVAYIADIVGRSVRGPFSPMVSATAKPFVRPTILTATPGPNPGEVTLSWTPGANATVHTVAWQKPGWSWEFRYFAGNASGTTITGLEPGQKYNFAVAYMAYIAGRSRLGPFSPLVSATAAQAGNGFAGRDRAALVALYKATGGPNWTRQNHWNTNKPISNWQGVITNRDGRVIELELQNNNLVGVVPENLGLLTGLQMLRLEGNDLWGCLPRWETLQNAAKNGRLKWVSDSESRFASYAGDHDAPLWEFVLFAAVLYAANEMGSAEGQRVAQNYLTPGLSLGLPPCPPRPVLSRKRVELRSQTTKTDAMALLDIYNYYVNYVDGNRTNPKDRTTKFNDGGGWGKDGKFMTYAKGAGSVDCPAADPFEDIHGVETEKFNGCHRVTSISFDKRGLYGFIPADFDRFGQLKYLNLSHNRLTGWIPPHLGNLFNLHTLALNNNYLTGQIPPHLGRLVGGVIDGWGPLSGAVVLDLHLQENYLSGRVPLELANIGYLRTIRIDPQYSMQNGLRTRDDLEGCLPSNLELDVYGTLPKALTSLAKKSFDKVREGVSILTPSETALNAIAAEVLNTGRVKANRAHAVWGGMKRDDYNQYVRDMTGKTVEAGLGAARIADEQGFWDSNRVFKLTGFVATLEAIDYYAELIKKGLAFIEDKIADVMGTGDRDDVACGVYGGDAP